MIAAAVGPNGVAACRALIGELGRLATTKLDQLVESTHCAIGVSAPATMTGDLLAGWLGTAAPAVFPAVPARSRGPFTFGALREGGLLLGRGRFSRHALYFGPDREGNVLVCSRLEPLVRLLGAGTRFDPVCLASLLIGAPCGDRTPYAGIHRARAGELLFFAPSGETRTALWPPRGLAPPDRLDVRDVAGELRRLIDSAIGRAVAGVSRVAVAVGGVDSSGLLAAMVARARGAAPAEVQAVTLHFAGLNDDRRYVSDLCRALQIEPVRVAPAEWSSHWLDPVSLDASPNTAVQTSFLVSMARWARARGIGVVLDGDGGDRIFDGDYGVFAEQVLRGHPALAVMNAWRLKGVPFWRPRERVSALVLRPVVKQLLPELAGAVRRSSVKRLVATKYRWAGPALRPILQRYLAGDEVAGDCGTDGAIQERLEHFERCSEYGGCALRQPYFDEDLADFVQSLPRELLFHGNFRRGLFRFAFGDLLPDSVRLRETKAGFGQAFAESFRAAGAKQLLLPYLPMRRLSELGLVDATTYQEAAQRLLDDPAEATHWSQVWHAIALEAFLMGKADGIASG